MWTQIIKLLEIKHKSDEEEEEFDENLLLLNDWIRREYKTLTCEELELAYNALVKEELTKGDGRIIEAYPFLDTKHVGEVIAAYRRLVDGNVEVSAVISKGLYLPQPTEPTDAEIDELIEGTLQFAIAEVRDGRYYPDHAAALYTWLFKKGLIKPTDQEWQVATDQAQVNVKADLIEQKRLAGQFERRRAGDSHGDHITPLRTKLGNRLASISRGEGDWHKDVRTEAFKILLLEYLRKQVKIKFGFMPDRPARPTLINDDGEFKPFSHPTYIQSLKEQLPTMGDEQVSDLQRNARNRNVLDVYELATAEWNARQEMKSTKVSQKKERK